MASLQTSNIWINFYWGTNLRKLTVQKQLQNETFTATIKNSTAITIYTNELTSFSILERSSIFIGVCDTFPIGDKRE